MKKLSFSRQPLVWLHVIALAISLAVVFGVHVTVDQAAGIMALLQAVAAAVGWTQVTPTAAPNLPIAEIPAGPVEVTIKKKTP